MSLKCNILSKKIWELCNENECWISAEHAPDFHKTVADYISRTFNENTEWKLSPFLFQSILQRFQFIAVIDLFASYLNKKLSNYVSWHPEPESVGVDAFNMSWTKLKFYTFPSFSLVAKSIPKIIQKKASGIMVIPWWPTQNWFSIMTQSLVDYPIILPKKKATLTLPLHENKSHPLFRTLVSRHKFIRKAMGNRDLQEEVMAIICLSWRDPTTSRHGGALRQWKNYCNQRGVDPLITDMKV